MQSGSLVECIRHNYGIMTVNGAEIQVMEEISIGEIRTVDVILDGIVNGVRVKVLALLEDPFIIHPTFGTRTGRLISCFREIQPPMSIPESLFNQSPEKVTV